MIVLLSSALQNCDCFIKTNVLLRGTDLPSPRLRCWVCPLSESVEGERDREAVTEAAAEAAAARGAGSAAWRHAWTRGAYENVPGPTRRLRVYCFRSPPGEMDGWVPPPREVKRRDDGGQTNKEKNAKVVQEKKAVEAEGDGGGVEEEEEEHEVRVVNKNSAGRAVFGIRACSARVVKNFVRRKQNTL